MVKDGVVRVTGKAGSKSDCRKFPIHFPNERWVIEKKGSPHGWNKCLDRIIQAI